TSEGAWQPLQTPIHQCSWWLLRQIASVTKTVPCRLHSTGAVLNAVCFLQCGQYNDTDMVVVCVIDSLPIASHRWKSNPPRLTVALFVSAVHVGLNGIL